MTDPKMPENMPENARSAPESINPLQAYLCEVKAYRSPALTPALTEQLKADPAALIEYAKWWLGDRFHGLCAAKIKDPGTGPWVTKLLTDSLEREALRLQALQEDFNELKRQLENAQAELREWR